MIQGSTFATGPGGALGYERVQGRTRAAQRQGLFYGGGAPVTVLPSTNSYDVELRSEDPYLRADVKTARGVVTVIATIPSSFHTAAPDLVVLQGPEGLNAVGELSATQLAAVGAAVATAPKPSLWEVLDRLSGTIEGPADWASQLDHYLYGHPKREP